MINKSNKTKNQKTYEDEIDLVNLIKFFIRNKKLIFLTTIIFFITSCIYGLLTKRVWEGKFEIVLEKEEPAPSLNQILGGASNNNLIQKLSDIGGGGVSLNTEVGILQSPSILLPIYDYINLKWCL